MAQDFAKAFYKSKSWKACRASFISRRVAFDGGLCEICKDKTGYIVHHVTKLTEQNINNPDIALNHCNLQYVCKACHDEEHYREAHKLSESVKFDGNGRIMPRKR